MSLGLSVSGVRSVSFECFPNDLELKNVVHIPRIRACCLPRVAWWMDRRLRGFYEICEGGRSVVSGYVNLVPCCGGLVKIEISSINSFPNVSLTIGKALVLIPSRNGPVPSAAISAAGSSSGSTPVGSTACLLRMRRASSASPRCSRGDVLTIVEKRRLRIGAARRTALEEKTILKIRQ